MCLRRRADDREPEARARGVPGTAGAGIVEPREPAEDALGIPGGDAGPVVGHREHRRLRLPAHRHGDLAACVPHGVVEQVDEQPAQRVGVAGHHARRHHALRRDAGRVHPHRDPRRGVARRDRLTQRAKVGGPPRPGGAGHLLLEPGEQQQVLGEPRQAERVRVHVARGLRPVLAVRMVERDLELGADRRDRAAQLVSGIRHQVPLALLRGGEAGEHVVERDREAAHLVAGRRNGEVVRQPGRGHLGRAAAKRRDRPQRVPRDQPGNERQQGEQQRNAQGERRGQRGHTVAHLGVGDRGDHDPVVVGDRHHAQQRRHAERRAGQQPSLAGARGGRRLVHRQDRDQAVRARRHIGDPAAGVEHLDGDRPGADRHRIWQPVPVRQRCHLDRRLPGRVVKPPGERRTQRAEQDQRRQAQGERQPGRRDDRQPGPQAAPPPPAREGRHRRRRHPPSAASRYPAPRTVCRAFLPNGTSIFRRR